MRPLRPALLYLFHYYAQCNFPSLGKTDSLVLWISVKSACMGSSQWTTQEQQCATSVMRISSHHINTFWGMSLGNCLEWKIKHFSYCCRYTQICMMVDIYSYTMWYMRQYLGIVQIFLFFCCILQSNSTLTSSYLCTPSILLYQVQRECARTLTIVAALLYITKVIVELARILYTKIVRPVDQIIANHW